MKTMIKWGMFLSLAVAMSCASSSKATPEEKAALDKMVTEKQFEVKATWAQPMANQSLSNIANAGLLPPGSTANRIDITGTGGYLRVVNDSVKAELPFFGERRMGGGYNTKDTGIHFEGIPKDFSLEPMQKMEGYTLKFSISEGAEAYQVVAQLYPNRSARLAVASSQRTNIWYQGTLAPYTEED